MKTGKTTRSADTMRAFAALAIALARGAAENKSCETQVESKAPQNHPKPSSAQNQTQSLHSNLARGDSTCCCS